MFSLKHAETTLGEVGGGAKSGEEGMVKACFQKAVL